MWKRSLGGGLSLTDGNSETNSYNFAVYLDTNRAIAETGAEPAGRCLKRTVQMPDCPADAPAAEQASGE